MSKIFSLFFSIIVIKTCFSQPFEELNIQSVNNNIRQGKKVVALMKPTLFHDSRYIDLIIDVALPNRKVIYSDLIFENEIPFWFYSSKLFPLLYLRFNLKRTDEFINSKKYYLKLIKKSIKNNNPIKIRSIENSLSINDLLEFAKSYKNKIPIEDFNQIIKVLNKIVKSSEINNSLSFKSINFKSKKSKLLADFIDFNVNKVLLWENVIELEMENNAELKFVNYTGYYLSFFNELIDFNETSVLFLNSSQILIDNYHKKKYEEINLIKSTGRNSYEGALLKLIEDERILTIGFQNNNESKLPINYLFEKKYSDILKLNPAKHYINLNKDLLKITGFDLVIWHPNIM